MNKAEHAAELRNDANVHYNCCQATLMPFGADYGLDEAQAAQIGAHFGGGMRCGATCGAVTGGLMALGLAGTGENAARTFMQRFQEENDKLDCDSLLAAGRTCEKKQFCDALVLSAVRLAEDLIKQSSGSDCS